ncbi:hypothetical protein HKD37_17G048582 [Glycine soja]
MTSLNPAINLAYVKKNCWNLNDPTVTFRRPHKAEGKRSEAPPSSAFPTSAPSTSLQLHLLQLHLYQLQLQPQFLPKPPHSAPREEVASPEPVPQSSPTPVLDDPQPSTPASVPNQPIVQDPPVALVLDLNEHAQDHS